jgi:hypothetical protein
LIEKLQQWIKSETQSLPDALADTFDLSATVERLAWVLHRLAKLLTEASTLHAALNW